MPSTYAHYRLGMEVHDRISGNERRTIDAWPQLYRIGLHGPDILFYYRALQRNAVNSLGYRIHEEPGEKFFNHAIEVINSSWNRAASLSYVYGLLLHFALDASCHGYVNQLTAETGLSHAEIEVEFDRALMLKDGWNPVVHPLTGHIHPTMENAEIIAPFYPGVSAEQIVKALKGMKRDNKLLLCKNQTKRNLVHTLMRVSGNYKEMHGLIVNPDGNPACEESNASLMQLYDHAEERGIRFIKNFKGYLTDTETSCESLFCLAFNGEPEKVRKGAETNHAYAVSETQPQ
ncbi:MAG: zinc dependent phospholipase C family protein [Eubacterium sp.]